MISMLGTASIVGVANATGRGVGAAIGDAVGLAVTSVGVAGTGVAAASVGAVVATAAAVGVPAAIAGDAVAGDGWPTLVHPANTMIAGNQWREASLCGLNIGLPPPFDGFSVHVAEDLDCDDISLRHLSEQRLALVQEGAQCMWRKLSMAAWSNPATRAEHN
ncbi:MAG TPA: hypothetical protein VMY98_02155, partial [Anaerolineae bacterium]|nr:hypothetical protein [Anaerolineae bacterium]